MKEEIRSSKSLGFRGMAMMATAIGAVAVGAFAIGAFKHSAVGDPPRRD